MRLNISNYKLKVESDRFKKAIFHSHSVDNKDTGHIKGAIQNIILNYGEIDEAFQITEGHQIAERVSELNPDRTAVTQSKIWCPLIWKALNYSGYDVQPEWFDVDLGDNDDTYRKFNKYVIELSSIKGWSEYAIEVLLNTGNTSFNEDDNTFDSDAVKELSKQYRESYSNKNFEEYKMSSYSSIKQQTNTSLSYMETKTNVNPRIIKIMTYNVYNFRNREWPIGNNTDSYRSYMEQIDFIKKENPDIIGLHELSFTNDATNNGAFSTAYVDRKVFETDLNEYNFIYKSVHKFPTQSNCNEKCLEIAIGIKKTYQFTRITIRSNGVGIKVEGIGIIVNNHIPFRHGSTKLELQSILDDIKKEVASVHNGNVIHMGDFNKTSQGFGNLMDAYKTDVTSAVTGLNQNKNIDRIYWKGALHKWKNVNILRPKMRIGERDVDISDHYPVIQKLEVTHVQNASQSDDVTKLKTAYEFKLMSWNIYYKIMNQVNKFNEIKNYIKDKSPNILITQESYFKDTDSLGDNYNTIWWQTESAGIGICYDNTMFTLNSNIMRYGLKGRKETVKHVETIVDTTVGLEDKKSSTERPILAVKLKHNASGKNIIVINVWAPHNITLNMMLQSLGDVLKHHNYTAGDRVIIGGDFNEFYTKNPNTIKVKTDSNDDNKHIDMYLKQKKNTCCGLPPDKGGTFKAGENFDLIFDNIENGMTTTVDTMYTSDHLPVIATVSIPLDINVKPTEPLPYVRKVRNGIDNPGAVCYMNATMNLLLDMPELLTYEGGDEKQKTLFNTLRAIYNSDVAYDNPDASVICLGGNTVIQQDASEWLLPVLDAIHTDKTTYVHEYFYIESQETFYCKRNGVTEREEGSETMNWENTGIIKLDLTGLENGMELNVLDRTTEQENNEFQCVVTKNETNIEKNEKEKALQKQYDDEKDREIYIMIKNKHNYTDTIEEVVRVRQHYLKAINRAAYKASLNNAAKKMIDNYDPPYDEKIKADAYNIIIKNHNLKRRFVYTKYKQPDHNKNKYLIIYLPRLLTNQNRSTTVNIKNIDITSKKKTTLNNIEYTLSGAVVHEGKTEYKENESSYGHYVYYQFINNKIYKYNDGHPVVTIDEEKIKDINTRAILILYQKVEPSEAVTGGGYPKYKINKKEYMKLLKLSMY